MILSNFEERYYCPKCATRTRPHRVRFGHPCGTCGYRGDDWKWEVSRPVWRWWPPRVEWQVAERD